MLVPLTSGALRAYDALAQTHPLAATSLVSCATYASAELFRQICLPTPKPVYASPPALEDVASSSSFSSKDDNNNNKSININMNKPLFNLRAGPRGILLMGIVGALIHAPWITFWFNFLESMRPGKNVMDILTKIVLDQTIGCPVYFILLSATTNVLFFELEHLLCKQRRNMRRNAAAKSAVVIGGQGRRRRTSLKKTAERVTDGMWNAVKLSWTAWPLLHAINYACVPVKRRRLVIQAGGLAWAMFLCCLTASTSSSKSGSIAGTVSNNEAANVALASSMDLLDSTTVQGFGGGGKRRKGVLETAVAMTGGDLRKPSFIISEETTTTAADLIMFPAMAAKSAGVSGIGGGGGGGGGNVGDLIKGKHHDQHKSSSPFASSILRLRSGIGSSFGNSKNGRSIRRGGHAKDL